MNKRIILSQPSVSVNDSGGRETTYTDIFTFWAGVNKTAGIRDNENGVSGLTGTSEFTIRKSTETDLIDKSWIIKYNSKVFVIHNIEKVAEEDFFIKITAKDRAMVSGQSSS